MSYEVENQCYVYDEATGRERGKRTKKAIDRNARDEQIRAVRAMILAKDDTQEDDTVLPTPASPHAETSAHDDNTVTFKHNPLHDLESVVWVIIWLFVCSEFVKPSGKDNKSNVKSDHDWTQTLKRHAQFAKKLFRKETFRRDAMFSSNILLSGFRTLLPQLREPAKALDSVREALVTEFVTAHKQRKQTGEQVPYEDMVESDIHATIIDFLLRTATYLARPGRNLKINVSAWAQQRKKLRDAISEDVPQQEASTTGTRRTLDMIQEGQVLSNKRAKLHRAQSASAAQPTGPAAGTRARMRELK